jgi:hypothetical protein
MEQSEEPDPERKEKPENLHGAKNQTRGIINNMNPVWQTR